MTAPRQFPPHKCEVGANGNIYYIELAEDDSEAIAQEEAAKAHVAWVGDLLDTIRTSRTYTSTLTESGERIPVEIPTRIPTPYQEWAAEQSAQYTRNRLYQNNAAQWLIETLEALADQADFTPSAVLNDLCETYRRKAAGR